MSIWRNPTDAEAAQLEAELARELVPGHPLHGRRCRAVYRRDDRDDVAFAVAPGRLAIVHLTYRAESDPRSPAFAFVEALPEEDDGAV